MVGCSASMHLCKLVRPGRRHVLHCCACPTLQAHKRNGSRGGGQSVCKRFRWKGARAHGRQRSGQGRRQFSCQARFDAMKAAAGFGPDGLAGLAAIPQTRESSPIHLSSTRTCRPSKHSQKEGQKKRTPQKSPEKILCQNHARGRPTATRDGDRVARRVKASSRLWTLGVGAGT